ncbi:MAG TPA: hypothetical protein VFA85_09455 [Terriglobales bacterium]|nr:hypothetical protein [Terriglobales bacterium]
MSLALKPIAPAIMRGVARRLEIPSCLLSLNDLRKLFRLLEQKAQEAADRQVAVLTLQPGQTPAQLHELQTSVRTAMALVLRLQTNSEWINGTPMELLDDDKLPDGLLRIEFDSAFMYRARFNNLVPNNAFTIILDLGRTSVSDMQATPQQNTSAASISGVDTTWANAVYDEVVGFFRQRRSKRGWLHLPRSYDLLLFLVGFPFSLDVVYHLDRVIRRVAELPQALSVALYVYVVLLVLLFFRISFNYARWAFPKVEIDAPRQHIAVGHRIAISSLALMVISVLVEAALKLVGIG